MSFIISTIGIITIALMRKEEITGKKRIIPLQNRIILGRTFIGGFGMKKTTNICYLSLLLAILVAIAAGKGLYHPDVYLNSEPGCLRMVGNQDFVLLVIFVPLLFLSTWLSAQTHYRGTLIWVGTVGYINYVYSGYAFGGISKELLLLLHVAISGLSFFCYLSSWLISILKSSG